MFQIDPDGPRYQVVPPSGTYPYWVIADTGNRKDPNFAVVSFWEKLQDAELQIRSFCDSLNIE